MVGTDINRELLEELRDRESAKWRDVDVWGEAGPPLVPIPRPQDWETTYRTMQDDRYAELELLVTNKEEMDKETEQRGRRATGGSGRTGGGGSRGVTGVEQSLIDYLEIEEEQELAQLLERAKTSEGAGGGLTAQQKQVLKVAAQKAKEKQQKYDEEVLRVEGIRTMIQAALGRGGGGGGHPTAAGHTAPLRARMPTFNSSGEDRSDYRSHLQAVKTCLSLQRVVDDQEKKQYFFLSFDQKARYRMASTLDPELAEAKRMTFEQYVRRANELFEPTSEAEIWKADFRQLIQKRGDSIQDYLQNKSTLYKRAYGSRIAAAEHLIEEAISGIFNPEVKKEVIRSMPQNYEELLAVGLRATGFVRRTGNYARPQDHGLASVSHRETGSRGGASGGGQLGQLEAGEEEVEEDWETPLTLEEVQCCVKNESEVETAYWHEQCPEGMLEEVGEGHPTGFKNLPPGTGCWSCGGPHYKAQCPQRMKVVQQKVGRRGGFGQRRVSKKKEYVNSNSRDARKGNYPVRQGANSRGTVGEVGEEEEEEEDWGEEVTLGGLRRDQGF